MTISLQNARYILGEDAKDLTDDEVSALIDALRYLSKKLLDNK